MPKYEYKGDTERSFPTLGITAKKGDSFDGPEGLTAPGLSIASSVKSAPAVSETKEKPEPTKSASSDQSAGA